MERYYVQVHLLEACNLRCAHCYQEGHTWTQKMDFTTFQSLLKQVEEVVSKKEEKLQVQINLTGGEPLLCPFLFEAIKEIKKHGFSWALLTNGTLLTDEIAQELASLHPVFVQVSLEGGKEMNDSIRGCGSFEQILDGITILKRQNIKTLVSFTVNARNWSLFPQVAEICRQSKVDKLWCDRYVGKDALAISTEDFRSFLTLLGKEATKNEEISQASTSHIKYSDEKHSFKGYKQNTPHMHRFHFPPIKYLRTILRKSSYVISTKFIPSLLLFRSNSLHYAKKSVRKSNPAFVPLTKPQINQQECSPLPNPTKISASRSLQFLGLEHSCQGIYQCGAGGNLLVVNADGTVLPCKRLPLEMGNIKKEHILDMLERDPFLSLSQRRIPDQCAPCRYRSICRGGAKCVTYAQTGHLVHKDVNCWL